MRLSVITPELSSTSTVDKFPTRLECRFSFSFSTSVCMMEFLRLNIIAVSDTLCARFIGTDALWSTADPLAPFFLYRDFQYTLQRFCLDLKHDLQRFLARYKFSDEIASNLFRLLSRILMALRTLYTQGLRYFLHPEINLRYYYNSVIDKIDKFEQELTSRLEFKNG